VLELLYLGGGRNSVLGEMTKVLLDVGNFFLPSDMKLLVAYFFDVCFLLLHCCYGKGICLLANLFGL